MKLIALLVKKYALGLALLFTGITIAGSLMPSDNLSSTRFIEIPHFDKVVHFTMYMLMGLSWCTVFHNWKKSIYWVFGLLFILGLGLEILQFYFLTGRFFEIPDLIANITGSILGIIIFLMWIKRTTR
jgi:VanZ family protein